ncbi:Putative sensory transduction regulator [Devosia enhydra]|uniref:Putative sensory transduction regulator n=1 Tax=Devosia enhydra TaxID=665118 RepID=A0A1K2I0U4_9HYPH|nr:YbjN domain-containing protein [Devosia enhydra]SFZ85404.1 Putative sensory transduction regulator [Devosia enhydra]
MKALSFALVAAFLPLPALAQTIGNSTAEAPLIKASAPEDVASEMQRLGYRAQLTTDNVGDPQIKSAAGGSNFLVWFYDCQDGNECGSIQFSVGFDTPSGLDLAVANEWNQQNRYGKAHLDDERDPYVQMDIAINGGMSPELFADNLKLWEDIVARFKQHIDW